MLFNKLDEHLRNETKLERFKVGVREWVKTNISIKPKPIFQSISAGRPPPPPEPPPPEQPHPRIDTIRRYLIPTTSNKQTKTSNPSTTKPTATNYKSQSSRMNSMLHYFPPVRPSVQHTTAASTCTATTSQVPPPSRRTRTAVDDQQ